MTIGGTRFAAIDFEGAGSAPGKTDEPVQVAVVHLEGGTIREALNSYVKPSGPVTWAAQNVHGITTEMLADKPALSDLWPEIKSAMQGRWIVAHGASTERRFLQIFPFHSFGPWVDTLVLARAIYPGLPSHALGDVVGSLGLGTAPEICAEGFRWHDARSDAIASLVLLRHMIEACGLSAAEPETLRQPDLAAYFKIRRS